LDEMNRLLDDSLLAIETGKPVRIEELIEIAPILEREAEDRARSGACVSLSISPDARRAELLGDAVTLRRLVSNLIDNALAYGREAAVTAEVQGVRLSILIDDKGPGISPEHREAVLEPFVRLEGSRNRRTGGSGLGLAIARNAAEAHGGKLVLEESPAGGTRARIELPLLQAASGSI
jgi:signal transduction histidine kinase